MNRKATTVLGIFAMGICVMASQTVSAGFIEHDPACHAQGTQVVSIGTSWRVKGGTHVYSRTWPRVEGNILHISTKDITAEQVAKSGKPFYRFHLFTLRNRLASTDRLVFANARVQATPADHIGPTIVWKALNRLPDGSHHYLSPSKVPIKSGTILHAGSYMAIPSHTNDLPINNNVPEFLLNYSNMGQSWDGTGCNGMRLMGAHFEIK